MNVQDPFGLRNKFAVPNSRSRSSRLVGTNTSSAQRRSPVQTEDTRRGEPGYTWSAAAGQEQKDETMSFTVPKNVPSFNNSQRELEDSYWGSSGADHGRHHVTSTGPAHRIGAFFEKQELPMYKDKPYNYSYSNRRRRWWRRKRFALGPLLIFVGILYWYGVVSGSETAAIERRISDRWTFFGWRGRDRGPQVDWNERREKVKEVFTLSWDAYEQYAWGCDEFSPIGKSGRQMAPGGLGWIIVDSLDTLMIMNLTSRLQSARGWVSTNLTYEKDHEVNTFETTIRMLGGLLSAHYLSTAYPEMAPLEDDSGSVARGDLYIEKATDLANRLLGAFESESGVPYASVNLKSGQGVPSHVDDGASSTAEAASLQLELKYLAHLTGEANYWEKAEKVIKVIDDNGAQDGLVPIFVYANSGTFRGANIRLGSRGDSYYEYLIKQYLQTSKQEPVYQDMWDQALAGVRKHLITYSETSNITVLGERPDGLKHPLSPKMDHLVCFMPGTIALGATGGATEAKAKLQGPWGTKQEEEMRLARELMQTCWGMYKVTKTGLAPEIAHFNIHNPPLREADHVQALDDLSDDDAAAWLADYVIKAQDSHNLQRPETVESLFYMWRITGDDTYRHWGWRMFEAFMQYSAVDDNGGFTSLDNVNDMPPQKRDNMESFWLAETLKYFYLLFSPNDVFPLDQVVINTEAHILPRFELGRLFSTGWTRKPRDEHGKLVRPPRQKPLRGTKPGEDEQHPGEQLGRKNEQGHANDAGPVAAEAGAGAGAAAAGPAGMLEAAVAAMPRPPTATLPSTQTLVKTISVKDVAHAATSTSTGNARPP